MELLEQDTKGEEFEGVFGVVYSDNRDEAEKLAGLIRERFEVNELIMGQISPVIGAHTGPGALGAGCF